MKIWPFTRLFVCRYQIPQLIPVLTARRSVWRYQIPQHSSPDGWPPHPIGLPSSPPLQLRLAGSRQPHAAGPRPPLRSASAAPPGARSHIPVRVWRAGRGVPTANAGQHSRQLAAPQQRSCLRRPAQRPSARPLDLDPGGLYLTVTVCPGRSDAHALPLPVCQRPRVSGEFLFLHSFL